MSDYISKAEAIEWLKDVKDAGCVDKYSDAIRRDHFNEAIETIESMPTVEAEPVRHGSWIKYPDTLSYDIDCVDEDDVICSECGKTVVLISQTSSKSYKFCPYCGAKMDGEEEI